MGVSLTDGSSANQQIILSKQSLSGLKLTIQLIDVVNHETRRKLCGHEQEMMQIYPSNQTETPKNIGT